MAPFTILPTKPSHRPGFIALALIAISLAAQACKPKDSVPIPYTVEIGKVRTPLKYRIISFHKGKADKRLIRLAHDLGFNGVEIQIEGSTVDGIKAFAKYDRQHQLVAYCHSLGMRVTVWVHELSDVPWEWMPEWMGVVTTDNQKLWDLLAARYDWMLGQAIPDVDGIVLTVVETQIRATDTSVLLKLVNLLRQKTQQYGKELTLRTFVWYPDEWQDVMAAVKQLPADQLIMSKCVPQDWNMRGVDAAEIGDVGGRPQIEEFDAFGEYFLRDHVANCMPDILNRQFDYGLAHHIQGICVRVDRDDDSLLHEPSEVNLWALGMLAAGATDDLDEIWNTWASHRYGLDAAPGVIEALKPTDQVVAELLSIGPFTFADTRTFPPLADDEIFGQNWQTWWWDQSYVPIHDQAMHGDPRFTKQVQLDKARAAVLADECLAKLESARDELAPEDYAILKTKLLTNKMQLAFRTPMELAVLHYRRLLDAQSPQEQQEMDQALQDDLAELRKVAMPIYPKPRQISYLGRNWAVDEPEDIPRDQIFQWAYQMDQLRRGEDPRATTRPTVQWMQ